MGSKECSFFEKDKALRLVAAAIGSMALMLFAVLQVGYFPFGEGVSLAAAWLGLSGEDVFLAPIWGALLKLMTEPSLLGMGGLVSALAGAIATSLFTYIAGHLLDSAVVQVEDSASAGERRHRPVVFLGAALAGLAFVFTPGFLIAATRLSPLMVQMALPFGALALVVRNCKSSFGRLICSFFAGVLMVLGAAEGMPGVLALPIVVVLVLKPSESRTEGMVAHLGFLIIGMGMELVLMLADSRSAEWCYRLLGHYRHLLSMGVTFPGMVLFLTTGVMPLLVLWQLCRTRQMTAAKVRAYFYIWAMVVIGMGGWSVHKWSGHEDRAEGDYVEQCLKNAEGRRWIISDGAFDDLILLKAPKGMHLVTLRREHEPEYGRLLAQWARERLGDLEIGGFGDLDGWKELEFAAEMGPSKFVQTMIEAGGEAISEAYVISARDLDFKAEGKVLVPRVFGWEMADEGAYDAAALAKEWERGLEAAKPRLMGKDGAFLRHVYAVQGNAIGTLASAAGNLELAWKVHWRVLEALENNNLSNLINLKGLVEIGHKPDEAEFRCAEDELNSQMMVMRSQRQLQWAFAHFGRLYVDANMRERVANIREELRKRAWESEEEKTLRSAFSELDKLYWLRGKAMKTAVEELENGIAKKVAAIKGESVAKWLFTAEMLALKGGRENLWAARDNYRKVLKSGDLEQCDLVADRLLSMDIALDDKTELEFDALLILRNNIRHCHANAILGTIRSMNGKHESAERYLKRAMEVGKPEPGMKNDLALALMHQRKFDEAELYIREAVRECPENWNYRETLSQVLRAAGKEDEAEKELNTARELAKKAWQLEAFEKLVGK